MKNILWIVCLSLGLMLGAPIDAQQPASQKPKPAPTPSQSQTELGKLIGIVEQMDKRLDRVENRLDRIEDRQDALDKKMDAKFDELNKKMDAQFEQLHNRIDTMFYWFMGIISALVAPIAISLGFDTYKRLRHSASPQAEASSPQGIRDRESAKQATSS